MRINTILSFGFLLTVVILAAGIASCSNPDERPLDTFFPSFNNPLSVSPVGLVISDPVFRQVDPDPLIREAYRAAGLTPLTRADMWNIFKDATHSIKLVGTRITNPNFVSLLVGVANKGIPIQIVVERGYFDDDVSAPLISQLAQTGNVTIKTDNDDIARQVHSRYAIVDNHRVLASSGDWLDDGFNRSINNILIFDTAGTYVNGSGPSGVKTLTDAFMFDFDQMFNMDRFGGDKDRLINHTFNIGVMVEVYFGPNDQLVTEITDEINNMSSSMMFAIRQLSDDFMLAVMQSFAMLGFYDQFSNPDYTEILPLAVPFPAAYAGYNTLNHKVILIDLPSDVSNTIVPSILELVDPVVISGSANWTPNGLQYNDEQMLIVHDVTLGYEFAVELGVLTRECTGVGVCFGTIRTNKNVAIPQADIMCDSQEIPGSVFIGDQGIPAEANSDMNGNYALMVPAGKMRNVQVINLGEASGTYLLPDPIWGPTMPSEGWNLMPGSSYEANFYAQSAPSATGGGGGGSGG
jgi:hypothetical protein